jgi:hypothetical protein
MSVPNIEAREEPSPDSSDNRIYWRQNPLFRLTPALLFPKTLLTWSLRPWR